MHTRGAERSSHRSAEGLTNIGNRGHGYGTSGLRKRLAKPYNAVDRATIGRSNRTYRYRRVSWCSLRCERLMARFVCLNKRAPHLSLTSSHSHALLRRNHGRAKVNRGPVPRAPERGGALLATVQWVRDSIRYAPHGVAGKPTDRKSTRLNSSHIPLS